MTGIDAPKRARARRLFAAALDTPGGLKVQTIHAFCTRILQRFPFEANASARFTVLEERAQDEMLERATLGVLLEAAGAPESALGRALATAVAAAAESTLREALREAIGKREALRLWIDAAGDLDRAMAQLSHTLGIAADDDIAGVEREIVDRSILPVKCWEEAAAKFKQGSDLDFRQAERLCAALAASGTARLQAYLEVFFDGDCQARKKLLTKPVAKRFPAFAAELTAEQERLEPLLARRNAVILRDRTAALVTIAVRVIRRYTEEKAYRGLLDYDDLIDKTLDLLTAVDPSWVHYKLDLGLDHVLVDEAQDISKKQWEIVKRLTSEFAAGAGARGMLPRTVFAVGDEKQSIFSFQGAAPQEYEAARRHFAAAYETGDVGWRFVRFDHSFRSGCNILGAVDDVFRLPDIYRSITADRDGKPVHLALPDAAPGLVDIWPLIEPDPTPETTGWDAPFDAVSETSPQVKLARKIAVTLREQIAAGTPIGHDRRPLRAGDVLVLVRQRGALFEAIIRALKTEGVAVAGADRLVLTEHIAVVDLLALADALLLVEDDLALAIALKSPLFGFDDDMLFALAWGRRGSLRAALAEQAWERLDFAAADGLLRRCADAARRETPFGFFAWLLGPEGGRKRIYARLGLEAADALDEFLELALVYEQRETPSLQGFAAWLRGATTVIKRDMEIDRDEVRVMTVHGAKGLEAPMVILADTTTPPTGAHPPRLLEVRLPATPSGTPACLVWVRARTGDVPAVADARQAVLQENEHEYRRLLYVAMTRAAERLIVCGYQGKRRSPQGCWYQLIHDGLAGMPGFTQIGDGEDRRWRYAKVEPPDEAFATAGPIATAPELELPPWLTAPAPIEPPRPVVFAPSESDADAEDHPATAAPRPAPRRGTRKQAVTLGRLVHRLMQSLPDVAPERRREAAHSFLHHADASLDAEERERLAAQALAILAHPRFAPVFAAGSRAEVPLVGRFTGTGGQEIRVSGQIDRLLVTADGVLITDYKSDRDPPQNPEQTPPAYVRQLALYRAVLCKLYPDRPIRAALLWTEIPDLMEVPAALLDQAARAVIR